MAEKIVEVTWGDAYFTSKDETREKLAKKHGKKLPYITRSLGFLVHRDKIGVTIAQSTFDRASDEFGETLFIPAGMVKRIRHLK